MICEFCEEPLHTEAIAAMADLFAVIGADQGRGSEWFADKGHMAWRNFRQAEDSISIPIDGQLLVGWLDGLS